MEIIQMPLKDSFSTEQWTLVAQIPFLAGFAVTAADPGGLIGAVQESAAMARVLQAKSSGAGAETLAGCIAAEIRTSGGRDAIRAGMKELIKGRKPAGASAEAIARLKDALAVVTAATPGELPAIKALVRETAQGVAEAAKEGGFMGFGGEKISDSERRTLADIDAVLAETGDPA